MALVRCPKHKIPFNDSNPRGCPACAQDKDGGTNVMQELARASQMVRRPSTANTIPTEAERIPVTAQPRLPVPAVDVLGKILRLLRNRRVAMVGGTTIALLLLALWLTGRPRFTAAPSPATFTGTVRPFPVSPNDPIDIVFSALGPQTSQPNPSSGTLERYVYGTDLFVDAFNRAVYAITLAVPNRSWRGLRVGMGLTNTEGTLALLGPPREAEAPLNPPADTVAGYIAYRSLDLRPRRTLLAEVRPPNNCFDVLLDIQPRSIGTLTRRRQKWVVTSRISDAPEWVLTRIRIVSRAMPGPYAGSPVC